MLDHHEGRAHLVAEAQQQRGECLDLALGNTARRFVEQDDGGPVSNQAGEVDDAPRAGGEFADEGAPVVAEVHQLEQLLHPQRRAFLVVEHGGQTHRRSERAAGGDEPLLGHLQHLGHRHLREQLRVLEAATQAGSGAEGRLEVGHVGAAEQHPARHERCEATDQIEQGGLARTVGADEPDDLASGDGERHAADGADATERARHIDHLERRRPVVVSPLDGSHAGTDRGVRQEHRAEQIGAAEQLVGRAAEPDATPLEEVRPVRHRQRHVHALFDEDDGYTLVGETTHHRQQLPHHHRGEAERQFVDEQHFGPGDECHAEGHHLLLAARQVGRRCVEPIAEDGEQLEHLGSRLGHAVGIAPTGPTGEVEILRHREAAEHTLATGHLAHAQRGDLVGRRVGDVATVEHHGATVGLDHPADRLQQRALAGTVGAEQGDDLAFLHVEVDVEQHLPLLVAHFELADQQQVGLTAATLVQRLTAGRRGLPHLGDVGIDHLADGVQHVGADQEQRGEHQHAHADAEVLGDPSDEGQHQQARDDPQ